MRDDRERLQDILEAISQIENMRFKDKKSFSRMN